MRVGTDTVLLAADERKARKKHLVKIRAKTAEAIAEGMDMTNLTEEDVQRVEDWIHTLPRKILGYETPQEHFDAALKNLRP